MKQDIVVPQMGESISEATIGTILKPTGSSVNTDDEILELETDKVNQVLHAPVSGVVTLTIKPHDVVKIGQKIGFVETEGKKVAEAPKEEVKKQPPPEPPKELKPVQGQARQGKEEFVAEIKREVTVPVKKEVELPKLSVYETRKKMPKIRRVIAEKLVEAQHNAAMLTTFNEVDLTQVIILRERYKEQFLKEYQVKLGFMPFFIKASVSALKAFPDVNAYIDGEDMVYRNYYDIGCALSTDKGLVVPVIRNCENLNFAQIEQAIDQFAAKAQKGTLTVEELKGGTFTITNGGVFGSLLSTPILNAPQTAILGMHKITKRPVAINDQVMIRPMMYLALTYDHRAIDGKEAVSFLVHIKQCIEDPARLLLEI